ncbi:recombination protein RecR, partial [Candidatus Sumerlaeota bacterium]|nr:recombination protein RecR [Candidatus Sumerlaeota bacterium]
MAALPAAIESLIHELTRLPGIGRRGAERIVTHLLDHPGEQAHLLADALERLRREIRTCEICGNWADGPVCPICSDERRRDGRICVVERPSDLYAFEQSGVFSGRYHVLGGTLSPLHGITPEQLRIEPLERRIKSEGIKEVIIATSPTVEGDATALYLAQRLRPLGVESARIGVGLPLGAN